MKDLRVCERFSDAVGWTPLVKLGPSVADLDCEVWAKIESMNPMGSVKDRIARHMILEALGKGDLEPGGVIVEASSGNTAMGMAMMANQYGLSAKMVMKDKTSREKIDALQALGVEVVLVGSDLPPEHPESYQRKVPQIVAEIPGAYFPDQHNNRANNEAHYRTTGPEIWQQMEGRIDVFVAGIGTGGTVSGVGRYLKEQDPAIRVVAIDVAGSVFTEYFHCGCHGPPGPYLLEGMGEEEIIACPEFEQIDDMFQVTDRDAFHMARHLTRSEGIFAGGSCGAALCGVRQVARRLDRPARIVTVFPDSGSRYLSTIYNDAWMRQHGLLEAPAAEPA
jgi:cystathionine beta-synthase